MEKLNELKNILAKDRKNLVLSIERACEARDKAPSAMESHSDTTRNQNEKLVSALEQQLKELDQMIKSIPEKLPENHNFVGLWNTVDIKTVNQNLKVLLVPEGLGGKKTESFITLAINTPLGLAIFNKKTNESYELNNNKGTITKIS